MTIEVAQFAQPPPQHPPALSPDMYPQGSAVGYLGALAQQYHNQQNQLLLHHQHQQMIHHHMMLEQQNQYIQQNELMKRMVQVQDSDGYQYSIQHQQLQLQRQLQEGLLSPAVAQHQQSLLSPQLHTPKPIACSTPAVFKKTSEATTPKTGHTVAKKRTNFHSIADLIGIEEPKPQNTVDKRQNEAQKPVPASTLRAKRKRIDENTIDVVSEPGNTAIDENCRERSSPAIIDSSNPTTCFHPIKNADTKSTAREEPISDQQTTTCGAAISPGAESRAVSPALSTVSSCRDTDTPCSVTSIDSAISSFSKDEEKSGKRARGDQDSSKRSAKSRRIFQAPQIHVLEQVFAQCQYPEPAFVEKLARDLDTTDGKIRVWFQNKRARWRKRSTDSDQSKQSPWLPGTPLYQPGNHHHHVAMATAAAAAHHHSNGANSLPSPAGAASRQQLSPSVSMTTTVPNMAAVAPYGYPLVAHGAPHPMAHGAPHPVAPHPMAHPHFAYMGY